MLKRFLAYTLRQKITAIALLAAGYGVMNIVTRLVSWLVKQQASTISAASNIGFIWGLFFVVFVLPLLVKGGDAVFKRFGGKSHTPTTD